MPSERQVVTQGNPPKPETSIEKHRSTMEKASYVVGLTIVLACVYSQYVGVDYGPVLGMLVVYGVPILAITLLMGGTIVRKFFNRTFSALKLGLGFFGAFTILGTAIAAAILFVLTLFDPDVLNLLNQPNPVLNVSSEFAWIMVVVSLLVVGPAEEYIFRGFVFGSLLCIFKNRHWLSLALLSSLFFGAVHLYYAFVYGVASLVQYADLVTFGMAMATTYYLSGGNLFAVALIHGVYDATGFIGVATSQNVGTLVRGILISFGLLFGLILLIEKTRGKTFRAPVTAREARQGITNQKRAFSISFSSSRRR